MMRIAWTLIALTALVSDSTAAHADDLEAGFRNPPHSAGIRAFWWWLNSNVTKEAVTRDLEEMKAKGFNGALIFDADGSSQRGNRGVPAGPVFGSPEWTELFVHACQEANRLDLELSLNIQSGWNLGGPKVTAEEATQTLVWSKTEVKGPMRVEQVLPSPQFRDFYRDVAVIAVPIPETQNSTRTAAGGKIGYTLKASSSQRDFPDRFTSAFDANPVDGKARNVQVAELALPGVGIPAVPAFRPIEDLHLKNATRELGGSAPDCRFLLNTTPALPGELAVTSSGILVLSKWRELPACERGSWQAGSSPHNSAKMDDGGTLRWDVPKGDWVILRIGHTATGAHVSTQSAGWDGRVLDYMNPKSLDAYWNRNIEPLLEAIGPLAGTTLRYVHTDSWEGGGMNWTPGFDRTFRERRGYDPLPWLAVLAGYVVDSREDSNAFLADFRKTIGDRVADHYGHLAALARRHRMATHPECSGPHAGPLDGLKNYGRSELMMSEFWSPSPHRPTPPNRFFVKQASSAAHAYGKRLVGAEAFTTIGPHWNDLPWSSMKPSFDHEFCAGLNLLFNHTFTCSPKEMGIPGQEYFAGTHFNPQVTWWNEAPALIDYFKRCQYLAQQGDFVADVVYYYGDHIPNIATLKESDPAGALPGFDYDVLSEELLLTGLTVENSRLALPSGMKYRVLVLPDHRVLSLASLKKVDELVRAGAAVLGPKPLRAVSLEGGSEGKAVFQELADGLWGAGEDYVVGGSPDPHTLSTAGLQSPGRQSVLPSAGDLRSAARPGQEIGPQRKGTRKVGKGRVAWGMPARDLLQADGIAPDVLMTLEDGSIAPDMDWIHYRIADAEIYFLAELAGKATSVDVTFRVDGRIPEFWDAVDGSIQEAATFKFVDGCTQVPLEFHPFDSIFVVFRKDSSSDRSDGPNFPTWQQTQTIAGPWNVTFDPTWGGPEQPVRFDSLTSWSEHSDPGIKYYSGKAVYRTIFRLNRDPAGKPLAIELGQVKDIGIARVKLNYTDLGVIWRPPFRVDVTKAVKPGENELEVAVVNSWRNRLIGDQELPEEKRLTRTNISVTKNWILESSGLLGPVILLTKDTP